MTDTQPTSDTAAQLPVVLETCVGMLPSAWRDKTYAMMLRFVGKRLAPELYHQLSEESDLARGRSIISDGLARAALESLRQDPEQVQRAIERFYGDQAQKQENLETIVRKAGEELDESIGGADDPPEQDITEDWRTKFCSYAEDVSDPEMQSVWARILAGEFRSPGAYSYRTLRLVSELSTDAAQLFEKMSQWSLTGNVIACIGKEWNEGALYMEARALHDWGLVQDSPGGSLRFVQRDENDVYVIPNKQLCGLVRIPNGPEKIHFPIMLLTQPGVELLKLLPNSDERIVLRKIINDMREQHKTADVGQIVVVQTNGLLEVVFDDLEQNVTNIT